MTQPGPIGRMGVVFILSNGHVSILHYSMLYLTGHGLTSMISKSSASGVRPPGPSQNTHTDGIEVTTGPFGQALGNGAIAIASDTTATTSAKNSRTITFM